MEHVKRLVLVPEHMVDQRKKPLVPPLTAQVQEIDSDMQDIMQRQDIPIDAQAKVYDQNLQRYLTFYDKRMNKPLQVNVVKPAVPEDEEKAQGEQIEEKPEEIETDILDSVPATMKSRTRQLQRRNEGLPKMQRAATQLINIQTFYFQRAVRLKIIVKYCHFCFEDPVFSKVCLDNFLV